VWRSGTTDDSSVRSSMVRLVHTLGGGRGRRSYLLTDSSTLVLISLWDARCADGLTCSVLGMENCLITVGVREYVMRSVMKGKKGDSGA
jgi:hypothetical protein